MRREKMCQGRQEGKWETCDKKAERGLLGIEGYQGERNGEGH